MTTLRDCPTCGHAVQVAGDTTQHYEPVGCLQLVDDHELCDRHAESLALYLGLLLDMGDDTTAEEGQVIRDRARRVLRRHRFFTSHVPDRKPWPGDEAETTEAQAEVGE